MFYNSFWFLFLAVNIEAACLTASGAWFQSLAESLLKLIFAATDFASSFHCLIELVLITLSVSVLFGLFHSSFNGYWIMFIIFHHSISLIWTASWLAEGRLYLLSNELELTCSLRLTLSSILSICFGTFELHPLDYLSFWPELEYVLM